MAKMKTPQVAWFPTLINLASLCLVASWDYAKNGANWANGQCSGGAHQQSPINLPTMAEVLDKQKVFLQYPKVGSVLPIYHNGHAIALTLPETYKGGFGVSSELNSLKSEAGNAFKLWQVNFHSPSEHTLDGKQLPLEMQLMHQRVTGGEPETAVVVVLFADAANAYNSFLNHLLKKGLPSKPWEETKVPAGLDLADVVGGSPFYRYTGSLTVPPCEAEVKYFVRQTPIGTAHNQLQAFSRILKETCPPYGNFRVAQPAPSTEGGLLLYPSVNLVKSPDVTVRPVVSKVDEVTATAHSADDNWQKHLTGCTPEEYDSMWRNLHRVRVGESKELSDAKTRYAIIKREYQAAESLYGTAGMNLKTAEMIYKSAPGPVDAINAKWNVVNAQKEFDAATARLGKISKLYPGPAESKLAVAVSKQCQLLREKEKEELEAQQELENKERLASMTKPAPPPEYAYSDPVVTLPRGLRMNPFANEAIDRDQSASAAPAKIAENLHQPDVPEGAFIKDAATKDFSVKKAPPIETVVFKVDLPIPSKNITDKDAFKKDILKALADSGKVSSSRMEVKEIQGHEVAKVHVSSMLAQQALATQPERSHGFLKSSPVKK